MLFNLKSRELWKNRQRRSADGYDPFARYHVSTRERDGLIDTGDATNAALWGSSDPRMIGIAAEAWKYLAIYGVDPSDIRLVMKRKPD